MNTFRVRVGRVVRHGGADVRVIDGMFTYQPESATLRREMPEAAARMVEAVPDMAGYALVVWDCRGAYGLALSNGLNSPIRDHQVARFVGDAIREDMTVNTAVAKMQPRRKR